MLRSIVAALLSIVWIETARSSAVDQVEIVSIVGSLSEKQSAEIVGKLAAPAHGSRSIVLFIDSVGGALPDVLAVADAVSRSPIPVTAYVRTALGTAVFLVASSQRIVTDAQGVVGGPGIVPRDYFPLSERPFMAVREELTSKLQTYASARGHDPEVFRAMVDPNQSLVRDGKVWKSAHSVLALSSREMIALRFAESSWRSLEEFLAAVRKNGPNKAPEPTPVPVTPRADEGSSK